MKLDRFKDISVKEFVRAILPSLPQARLDEFCNPVELEASQLHAKMPYDTELFLFRNDERCEIHLSHGDQIVNIAARFLVRPHEHDDIHSLPHIQLNSIQIGKLDELKQHIYSDGFYAEGHKPNMLENFRNRAQGMQVLKAHDLTPERMAATGKGLDYACQYLSARITPPRLDGLAPLFSTAPVTSLKLPGSALRLHRIKAGIGKPGRSAP